MTGATRHLGPSDVVEAAAFLMVGGLVAFPTETVYGLGADASNDEAIALVYEAKGRPVGHPLIVHLSSATQLHSWCDTEDERVDMLAAAFWPGPLTLVVPKSDRVSMIATGGRQTVGLRVPDHKLARSLISMFGGAIVGPSANSFGHVSPTTVAHVLADLDGRIDAVLDGGPATVGIESTIIEIVDDGAPTLLRPGGISIRQIEEVLGEPVLDGTIGKSRAAGMLTSHYAPRAPVRIVSALGDTERATNGKHIAVIASAPAAAQQADAAIAPLDSPPRSWILPEDAEGFGRELYAALRAADATEPDEILVIPPSRGPMLLAVLDRLSKAAAQR